MLGGQIRSPDDFEEGDFRTFAPRFSAENFPKNLKLVDRLTEIAKKKKQDEKLAKKQSTKDAANPPAASGTGDTGRPGE